MGEKNRRLVLDNDIIYPFTRQENVIGLQKTIKEKLPIVSTSTPDSDIERQVWIDTNEASQVQQQDFVLLSIPNSDIEDNFENSQPNNSSNSGQVENNFSSGQIEDNFNEEQVENNSVNEQVEDNFGNEQVESNSVNEQIENNFSSGQIENNFEA